MSEEIAVRETGCLKPLDRPIVDLGLFQLIYCRSISSNIECESHHTSSQQLNRVISTYIAYQRGSVTVKMFLGLNTVIR